jgi:galactokinase
MGGDSCGASAYAHVCSCMLTYAHVCSRMLTYAGVSIGAKKGGDAGGGSALALLDEEEVRMLTYADVCSRMLTYADVC